MAGCITAALFLRRFVPDGHRLGPSRYLCVARCRQAGPSQGRRCLGLRAAFGMLRTRYPQRLISAKARRIRRIFAVFPSLQHFGALPVYSDSYADATESMDYERGFANWLDEGADRLRPIRRARSHQPPDGAVDAGLSHARTPHGARARPGAWGFEARRHSRLEHSGCARLSAAREGSGRPPKRIRRPNQ